MYTTDRNRSIEISQPLIQPVFSQGGKNYHKITINRYNLFNPNWSETILISSKLQFLKLVIRLNSLL